MVARLMVSVPLHFMSPSLVVLPHPQAGNMAVFAQDWIAPGQIISVWGGHILTKAHLAQIPPTRHCYSVQVEEDLYLASINGPESADFINHSCTPNAGMRDSITMVAMRLISPNEEVCFDYAMTDGSAFDEFDCHCGTKYCRGRVTGDDWKMPALWKRYDGYFSPYLQRRINQLKQDHCHLPRTIK
jgi:hypothetical protein